MGRILRYSHRKTRLIANKSATAITSGAIDYMDHEFAKIFLVCCNGGRVDGAVLTER